MRFSFPLRKTTELGVALTAIATLILAGCGGSANNNSTSTTTTTVTPYKGVFTNGSVVLKDANGNVVSLISGGSINASGVASVTYPSNVAYPLTIEVSGTFLDETSGVGATGTISAGAPLRGLIPAVADAQAASGVPVTVVTELARTMLPASGFSAASAVAAITGAASSVLGSTYGEAMTAPVFNAQGQTSNITTLKLTALAHVINQQGAGANLPARLQNISSQLAAGSAVNAVIPQTAFNNALGAINGGASSVLPVGATPPTIPAFTLPSGSLGGAIAGSGGAVGSTPSITGFNPSTGAVGTSVTITGTNLGSFIPAPVVKFGTTTATVSSATATSITVAVPASLAAGNSAITLSNLDGTGVVNVGTFTVTTPVATTPDVPVGLTATVASSSQINLSWSAAANATGYNIYRANAAYVATSLANKITATPITGTSYNDTGLTAGTTYFYRVAAVNTPASLQSMASTEVSATTTAAGGGGGTGVTLSTPFNSLSSFAASSTAETVSSGVTMKYYGDVSAGTSGYMQISHQVVMGTEVLQVNVISASPYAMTSLNTGVTQNCALSGTSSLCSAFGINFNRAAGTVSFSNTPLAAGLSGSGTTLFTISGNLTFTPF